MHEEGYQGDRPLIVRALIALRRYFWFEKFTLSDPDEDAQRRAVWPLWRRAVRPIGATAWWIVVIVGLVSDHHVRIDAYGGLLIALLVVVLCCLTIWAVTRFVERQKRRGQPCPPVAELFRGGTTTDR